MARKSNEDNLEDEKIKLFDHVWAYSQLEMHKEMLAECEKLIKFDPDDASSFIELGLCYEENDEIEKAIECYKYIIKKFPMDSKAYINLGHIYEKRKKRNDMAMVCYEKAAALNPSDEWAINNIGAILQKESRWKDALIHYEKAYEASKLNGEPNNLILHNLAWAHYHCKNYRKSMDLYQQLARDDSDNAAVYSDFGCVNYRMGLYGNALSLFEKASKMCPNNRHYNRLCLVANSKVNFDTKGLSQ